jgi:hypothetical protein
MANRVGLWIDHQLAVIVSVSEQGESVKKIESGAKHVEYRGAQRNKVAYSAQYSQGDNQLDNQFAQQLHKFYEKVINELREAERILIFGPAEAKSELKRLVEQDKSLRGEVHVEAADRMSDRQIVARVRKYFEEVGRGA